MSGILRRVRRLAAKSREESLAAQPVDAGDDPAKAIVVKPHALKQFWWDLWPARSPDWLVPRQSGIKILQEPDSDWVTAERATKPQVVDQARRAPDQARQRAEAIEKKAAAQAGMCLTVFATGLALSAYQLKFVRKHHYSWLWLTPAVASVACLAVSVLCALEIQRPGIYQTAGAETLVDDDLRLLVQAEETGRRYADATTKGKVDALMQSRAWLSRAIVLMLESTGVALWVVTNPPNAGGRAQRRDITATTAVKPSSTSPTVFVSTSTIPPTTAVATSGPSSRP